MQVAITVRRPSFDLTDLPHRWVGGSRLATWFGDAAHVFIPLGEQFFIDAVREFRDRVEDEDLRRELSAFIGQEAIHSRVHEAVWSQRREHGVPVDAYAEVIRRFQALLDPIVPAELKLATTAALEHYTAAFGRAFLVEDIAPVVGEEMAALLRWHGAEEIEHRSVAFDVLALVDAGLSLRLAGLALGSALITTVPAVGVALFAAEEVRRGRFPAPRRPDPVLVGLTGRLLGDIGRELVRYVVPGFRPGDDEPPSAYEDWLAREGSRGQRQRAGTSPAR
jgi:predicted metal-dependent hydrolase